MRPSIVKKRLLKTISFGLRQQFYPTPEQARLQQLSGMQTNEQALPSTLNGAVQDASCIHVLDQCQQQHDPLLQQSIIPTPAIATCEFSTLPALKCLVSETISRFDCLSYLCSSWIKNVDSK